MLLALIVALVAAVIGRLRGGSFAALAATSFRAPALLWASLAIQVGLDVWGSDRLRPGLGLAVLLGTNALVAGFLALNHRLPGMVVAALGMGLNVVVIAANGAMPVSRVVEKAGVTASDLGIKHEFVSGSTRLPWLGDVIPVPGLDALVSAGDVVLAGGIAWLVYRRMLSREDRERA